MYRYEKVIHVEGHKCILPQEEDLIDLHIYGGIFVDLRRKLRRYMTVCPSSPETKTILRSSSQIRAETARHLRYYYNMIHPFSQGRACWENIMIVVYSGLFFMMPLELAVPITIPLVSEAKLLCDIASMVDIVLWFCTGYYNEQHRKVYMKWSKVFNHYVFSYFIADVVSSIPYDYIINYVEKTASLRPLKYLFLLKLIRLPTYFMYIQKFCTRIRIWNYKLKRMNLFLFFNIIIWWSTGLTFHIYRDINNLTLDFFKENSDIIGPVMQCCLEVVKGIMLIRTSDIYSDSVKALIFNSACLILGLVVNIIILGQVMQKCESRSESRNKYGNLMLQIGEYMQYKEIPISIQNRVFRYVEFKFQKNIFREEDILLSKLLKQDVLLHNCRKLVERVDFFKQIPSHLILKIIKRLKSEIYLPNDVIVQAGVLGSAMYFIFVGTVAVYTKTGKEICHLEDGSYFGEISLLINEPRVATVIAVTDCEVFRLSRKDFLEILDPYPLLYNKVKSFALERLRTTKKIIRQDYEMEENEKIY